LHSHERGAELYFDLGLFLERGKQKNSSTQSPGLRPAGKSFKVVFIDKLFLFALGSIFMFVISTIQQNVVWSAWKPLSALDICNLVFSF
jgi:hypothetical protein